MRENRGGPGASWAAFLIMRRGAGPVLRTGPAAEDSARRRHAPPRLARCSSPTVTAGSSDPGEGHRASPTPTPSSPTTTSSCSRTRAAWSRTRATSTTACRPTTRRTGWSRPRTDDFATDRITALAVNDPQYLPADAAPHEGLINKWPFEAEKKTYPYWDGTRRPSRRRRLRPHRRRSTASRPTSTGSRPVTPDRDRRRCAGHLRRREGDLHRAGDRVDRPPGRAPGTRSTPTVDPCLVLDLAFTDEQVAANGEDSRKKRRPAQPGPPRPCRWSATWWASRCC